MELPTGNRQVVIRIDTRAYRDTDSIKFRHKE
jgi:hypothetical protein